MYVLKPWKKLDPVVRWNLPDRIFFGYGACRILAGVYLRELVAPSFEAYWIKPTGHSGAHVFVSDGQIAFDYHGYSTASRLKKHHRKVWTNQYPDWDAGVVQVDFDLLDTRELNDRNMRGPDQYLGDPIRRAIEFIGRANHAVAISKARRLALAW